MNFAVYSKDGCPYCDKIKQVMDLTKLSYVVYNLNEDFDRDSFYGDLGLFFLPPERINSKPRSMWSVDLFMSLLCDFVFSQEFDCVRTTS